MKIKLLIKNNFVKHKKIYITFFCLIFVLLLICSMFFGKSNSSDKMMSIKDFTDLANSGSIKRVQRFNDMLIIETKDGKKVRVIFSLTDYIKVVKVLQKNNIKQEIAMKRK